MDEFRINPICIQRKYRLNKQLSASGNMNRRAAYFERQAHCGKEGRYESR